MNEKQKIFVTEYIKDLNATQAAKRAGYSEKSAHSQGIRLLKDERIKNAITKSLQEVRKNNVADTIEIEEFLTSVMRGNEFDVEMINVGDFRQELIDVPVKNNQRIKAAELLGKRYAMWTERVEQTSRNIEIIIGDNDDFEED